jgi:hypothetical protein
MMILSAARSMSPDVTISKYGKSNEPSDADEATASPWIKSEYYGDRYNENTDCGSVGDEKLHHSR